MDESLITEKNIIQEEIEKTEIIPDFSSVFGHQIEVKFLDAPLPEELLIKDSTIYDEKSADDMTLRYIYFCGKTPKNMGYTIGIFQSLSEKEELLEAISLYMFGLFLTIFFISIISNYLISRQIWKPFYKSVDQAGRFDVLSGKPLDLPETNIKEFQKLNRVFENMTQKMRNDYINLKEYNENASHEIQTPLAVIRSKTELLMQNKHLNKDSLNHIKSINAATSKLFKLNQGLLLISKIDNQYFIENKEVSLKQIVENCFENYKEITKLKGIIVEIEASDPAMVEMNEVLADVLISNLISNAVRYNLDKGFIKCTIDDHYVSFENSGLPIKSDPELLFRRFNKGSDNSQSVGLGLSIVRKITDNYKMQISYRCDETIHKMILNYHQ